MLQKSPTIPLPSLWPIHRHTSMSSIRPKMVATLVTETRSPLTACSRRERIKQPSNHVRSALAAKCRGNIFCIWWIIFFANQDVSFQLWLVKCCWCFNSTPSFRCDSFGDSKESWKARSHQALAEARTAVQGSDVLALTTGSTEHRCSSIWMHCIVKCAQRNAMKLDNAKSSRNSTHHMMYINMYGEMF